MEASENFELTTDGRQQETPKAGAELTRGKFFPWMICILPIVSILMSAVTLGIVANLKNSEMTNGSLTKLQSDVSRLIEIEYSEMANSSLAKLKREISRLKETINPIWLLNTWRPFEENEYYFTSIRYIWNEAEQFCVSINSNLVVINSQEEQQYIRMNTNCDHWIGLHDSAEEGIWRWVDGTEYTSNDTFWGRNQPNGRNVSDEDCVVVTAYGQWHDLPCNSTHFVICERPAD
ncbi:hepatic lectin-like [Hemitrygon akajei]|uniref:hepatic lectin-like n=1 Tax=Hemitrygon akajei TaxID=2704970 RepID=UPI003BF9DFDA